MQQKKEPIPKSEEKDGRRRDLGLKIEKISLKTGLRGGIHDSDQYG